MKGLSPRFRLANGKFVLTDGSEKAKDSIWFYCVFDRFRIYVSDFGGKFSFFVQKPVSYILMYKTILFSTLRNGILKYVPNVDINTIDIGYLSSTDRKNYTLLIDYSTVLEDKTKVQNVMFV